MHYNCEGEKMSDNTFSKRLRELRAERKTTQKQCAESLGVKLTNYNKWENGITPSLEVIANIADYYEVSTDYLLGKESSTDYDSCNTFSERLVELRNARGLSQDSVAVEIGICKNSIYYYENNKRVPDANTIIKLAQFYNVSSDYLLGISDIKNNVESKGIELSANTHLKLYLTAVDLGISVNQLAERVLKVFLYKR